MISAHDIWGSKESFSPMYKILYYLASKGYEIDFISIEKKKIFDESSKMYGEPIEYIHKNVSITRVRVGHPIILNILNRFPTVNRLSKKIRMEYIFPRKVYKLLRVDVNKYDLIYGYEIHAVQVAKKLSIEAHKPLVTRFQGTFLLNWYSNSKRWYFKKKYKLHIIALSTPANLIVMTNDGTQGNKALELLNNTENLEFLRNGIDFEKKTQSSKGELRKKLNLPLDKVITISVSRLAKWKKLERIIYAYQELIKNNKECVHIFIGEGEERKSLEKECKTRGLSKNMFFIGQVDHEKVSEYLSAADIFISLFDSTNIGNPLQEAIKMELPIVTYDVGDTKELIIDGYNGTLLKSVEPVTVANAIERMVTDNNYRENIINGVKRTSEFLWTWDERLSYEEEKIRNLIEADNN